MNWVAYKPDEPDDDIEEGDVDDPFVFVWKKFWNGDRDLIKIAIMQSDKNKQGAYDGIKQFILKQEEQKFEKEYFEEIQKQWPKK